MGGYGSGRHGGCGSPKTTVEDCLSLSADALVRFGLLKPDQFLRGSLTWTLASNGEKTSSIGSETDARWGQNPTVRLYYTVTRTGESVDYTVRLATTPLPWGGVRWWFLCPLSKDGCGCGRRVGKLYLPRSGRYFGCRHCYDLIHRSTRTSHALDSLALAFGLSPAELKKAFAR